MPSQTMKAKHTPASACLETLESRVFLTVASAITIQPNLDIKPMVTSASPVGGYTPQQIRDAYGFNQISINGAAGDGSGQTIAIVGAYNDPNIASDLGIFDKQYSLGSANLKVVSQTGGSVSSIKTDGGWASELALDVEWAHAMAPKANILVVEAKTASLTNLLAAVDYARKAPGVSVVSMSWGGSEFWGQSAYDSYFTTPAGHQGVTFVAASGDSGSWWGPSWPATSPNVLGVGGTSLNLTSSGYSSESGWYGSGGGISSVVNEPSYQNNVQNTGARTSPDVSYNADPNTGFAYYSSVPYYGYSGWDVVGGTSAGTPQWAALIAIANQARAANHVGSLDGATGTLPILYSLYNNPTAYAAAFHDVTTGASSWYFGAGTGYDAVTGLGTPKANGVVAALSGATVSSAAKTAQTTVRVRPRAVRLLATSGSTDSASVAVIPPAVASAAPAMQFAGRDVLNAVLGTRPSASALGATPAALSSVVTSAPITTGDLPALGGVFATAPLTRFRELVETVEALPAQASAAAPAVAGSAAAAVTDSVQSVAAAIPAAAAPATRLYHIPRLDVVGAFSDAWDSLAQESAAATPQVLGTLGSVRAWVVTAAVASADAALVAYWLIRRRKSRKPEAALEAGEA